MSDCLFCRIVAGDIPADVVHRGDRTLAFRDINPQAPTHVLVVPHDHHENIAALCQDVELLHAVVAAAAEVADSEGLTSGGWRLVFNTGADAGQTVFHVHAHVLGGKPLGGLRG